MTREQLTRDGLIDAIFHARRLEDLQNDVRKAMVDLMLSRSSPEVDGSSPSVLPSFLDVTG